MSRSNANGADDSNFCSPSADGSHPSLHRPITLACGHTLSAEHISIPTYSALALTSDLPHETQTRQSEQRLSVWAGISCPIPACKRNSQGLNTNVDTPPDEVVISPQPARPRSQSGEILASGVTYYPPPSSAPPAYLQNISSTSPIVSPLLDICVDKTLQIVLQELAKGDTHDALQQIRESASSDGESSDEEESEDDSRSIDLAQDTPVVGDSSDSPRDARLFKRRRNARTESRVSRPTSTSSFKWPFQKEIFGILECDVCAMLLHQPVTTPCQHVSASSDLYYVAESLQSFCSKCLSRSLDHSSRCPVCRQDLPSFAFFQDHAVNKVLLSISR